MKKQLKTLLSALLLGVAGANAQNWNTAVETGYNATPLHMEGGSGSINFVCGSFGGNATFGSTILASSGSSDAFLARMGSSGSVNWAIKAGGTNADAFKRVVVVGNTAIVYGTYSGSITFYGTSGTPFTLTGAGAFLARYDNAGVLTWAVNFNGSAEDMTYNTSLQQLYTVGHHGGSGNKVGIRCYNGLTGANVWTYNSTNTGYAFSKGIGVDATGNSYILTEASTNFQLSGSPLIPISSQDLIMMKLDANGVYVSHKQIGNPGNIYEFAGDLDCTSAGDIYITGTYSSGTAFMDGTSNPLYNLTNSGGHDLFLAKYNSALAIQWASKISGTGDDMPLAMALDPNSHPFIAVNNKQWNSVTVDPCSASPYNSVNFEFDNKWYMVKYLPTGSIDWSASPLVENPAALPVGIYGTNASARVVGRNIAQTDFGTISLYGGTSLYIAQASKLACKPTAIEENTSVNLLSIYPNPGNGIFNITTHFEEDANIEVMDMFGRTIQKAKINANTAYTLDLSTFAKGIYLVNLVKEGKTHTQKIVLQ